MSRVTSEVTPFNGRYRAEVKVDGHKVEQAFFITPTEAKLWCAVKVIELREVVRE